MKKQSNTSLGVFLVISIVILAGLCVGLYYEIVIRNKQADSTEITTETVRVISPDVYRRTTAKQNSKEAQQYNNIVAQLTKTTKTLNKTNRAIEELASSREELQFVGSIDFFWKMMTSEESKNPLPVRSKELLDKIAYRNALAAKQERLQQALEGLLIEKT